MAEYDADAIVGKIKAWMDTPKGQKRMQSTLNNYITKNRTKTEAGSEVVTLKRMQELANKLVLHVRNSARASGLPPSVIAHFDSLRRGHITKIGDGTYQVELAFTDDLSRPSLQPSKYRGVDNIIAIFNSGYPANRSRSEAISHVYGWWNGKYTQALPYRPGLYFMQTAINDFNEVLGARYDVFATLDDVYNE